MEKKNNLLSEEELSKIMGGVAIGAYSKLNVDTFNAREIDLFKEKEKFMANNIGTITTKQIVSYDFDGKAPHNHPNKSEGAEKSGIYTIAWPCNKADK